jgi:hypothetical protein
MDNIDAVPTYIKWCLAVDWCWDRRELESVLSNLGLRIEKRNESWTAYSFPDKTKCLILSMNEQVVRVEICVDIDEELGKLRIYHPTRYCDIRDSVFAEFEAKYRRAVKHTAALLGAPEYEGNWEDPKRPDPDAYPIRLAAWSIAKSKILVEYQHEDNELPLIIAIVILPEAKRGGLRKSFPTKA